MATLTASKLTFVPPSPAPVTKPKPDRIVKNGIKLPNAGTSGEQCWGIADKVQKANPKLGIKELRKLVIEAGVKAGVKKSQMSAETSSWSKFNGLR